MANLDGSGFRRKRLGCTDEQRLWNAIEQLESWAERLKLNVPPEFVSPSVGSFGRIPEANVIFDPSAGHDHDGSNSKLVTLAGDAIGTNAAVVVDGIHSFTVATPTAGDDAQFLRYNHGTTSYSWEPAGGGVTVEENNVSVGSATTIDFGAGFDVSLAASEADITLDYTETASIWGTDTPALIPGPGTTDDYALHATARLIRLSAGAAINISSFVAPTGARDVILVNIGAPNITILNAAGTGTAANRVLTGTGADVTLTTDQTFHMVYDPTTARWRGIA